MVIKVMNSESIKRLRKSLKLTQATFADRLGVAKYTIYRWEAGKCNPHPIFIKMMQELKEATIKKI